MPRTPQVQRNIESRARPTGATGPMLRAPQLNLPSDRNVQGSIAAVGQAGVNAARGTQAVANALGDMAQVGKNRGDAVAMMEAQRKLDDYENANIYDPETGALSRRGKDAMGVAEQYDSEWNAAMSDIWEGLANDDQKNAFSKMALSRRASNQRTLLEFERRQMDEHAKVTSQATIDSSVTRAAKFFQYPEVVDSALEQAKGVARIYGKMNGLPEEAIKNQELEIESKGRFGVLQRLSDTNPSVALKYFDKFQSSFTADDLVRGERMMSPVRRHVEAVNLSNTVINNHRPVLTQDGAINYVMNELEGGDKLHTDNDGGLTRYGINENHNPDADVSNMTEEQAKARYKTEYWDKLGVDKMPADMRLVAFDAGVQHGVDAHTKEMIEGAGGDARKLIAARRDYYKELVKNDPEKNGEYLDGWMNRMDKLEQQVAMMRGSRPKLYDAYKQIDEAATSPEAAADAKKILKQNYDAMDDARKKSEEEAADEAYRYIQVGQPIPASVESRMNPKEVVDLRESRYDPTVYEGVRQRVLLGQPVNLREFRSKLGNKYEELVKLQQDPTKIANSRKVDDVIKSAQGVLLKGKKADSADAYRKMEQFRRVVDMEVEAYQRNTGKPVGVKEMQQITDYLLLEGDMDGMFKGDRAIFQMDDELFEVDGVDNERSYVLTSGNQSKPLEYGDMIRMLSFEISESGRLVDEDSIAKRFEEKVANGEIKWLAK